MKRVISSVLAAAAVLLPAALALASEATGGHGGAESHGLPWVDFFIRLANFAIFIGLIVKLAGPKIKEFFGGRQYQIKAELEDLSARRKDAEAKLKDVEKSIANMDAERAAILAEYAAQGESLKASIVAEARRKAALIESQARTAAEQEAKVAVEKIRGEMAEMVVVAAEKLLAKKLDAKAHQKLVDDSLTKVVLN